jgi:hypothetical protein
VELRKKHRELSSQHEALKELLTQLVKLPENEAQELFRRLRASNNLENLVDLVFQEHVASTAGDDGALVRSIEQASLEQSTIKVRARPWTRLVGDGLASELVSSFMAFDQPFMYSFIDKERFLEDMHTGSPESARYCSPFLVNAICSLRSHTSRAVASFDRVKGTDLSLSFLDEAKRLFHLESGKVSLPTAQGLAIVFMCCAGMGQDRAGRLFRHMAYDMLKRLQLIRAQKELNPLDEDSIKWSRAASRASWGFYCFDSIAAFAYAQPSLILRPTSPRAFLTHRSSRWRDGEFDPATVLDAMCDLSVIYNEALSHHLSGVSTLGSEYDLSRRSKFLSSIRDWRLGLSEDLHVQNNPTKVVYMLRSFEDQVIVAVVRDLHHSLHMPLTGLVVKDIMVSCYMRSLESIKRDIDGYTSGLYSSFVLFPLYGAAITLLHLLGHPDAGEPFISTCKHLRMLSSDFPFTRYVLLGLKELAVRLDINLPAQATPYFVSLDFTKDDLQDVPITFVIPDHAEVAKELVGAQEPSETAGIQLGAVITKIP